ncbi:hypothetical protein [Blastopirellula marina]|uniref:Uncharacterized protein n=1 Tax=Blastopirellula marina DSM 3645 TaxID=314230 RepID=A3ZN01_9BACT|nr:hypothetical protein [Blastopirellula marina]EAQ82330.1 hypothetical protein DSM3645_01410 [Blastopirellula marina DSM 3645]
MTDYKSNAKKIEYTESGKERLAELNDLIQRQIEDEIRERKFLPGDDVIEVTASDIEEVKRSMRLRFHNERAPRLQMTELVTRLYLVIGILLTLAGIMYPLLDTIRQNPIQYSMIGMGVVMSLMSMFMTYYVKMRRETYLERDRIEIEREMRREKLLDMERDNTT